MARHHDDDRTHLEIRGTRVPKLGFGTWQLTGEACATAVRDALDLGYRHIDTARSYDNEREVGAALSDSGVDRDQIFLTTKIWMDDFEPGRLRAAAEDSLNNLGTDYVDLLLLHWPNPDVPLEQSLGAMVELRDDGLIRELGVSNFPPQLLLRALDIAPVFCNQVEFHPFLGQEQLLSIASERDVMLTAYAPLAQGKVLHDPVLKGIAEEQGSSPGQVALSWVLDHANVSAIPKASRHENRMANLQALDVTLTTRQRALIDRLPKHQRDYTPHWAPDWAA